MVVQEDRRRADGKEGEGGWRRRREGGREEGKREREREMNFTCRCFIPQMLSIGRQPGLGKAEASNKELNLLSHFHGRELVLVFQGTCHEEAKSHSRAGTWKEGLPHRIQASLWHPNHHRNRLPLGFNFILATKQTILLTPIPHRL